MKQSRFNFFVDLPGEENFLAYNAITNGLCLLEPDLVNMTEVCQNDPDLEEQLRLGGYLVEDDFDELKLLRHRQAMVQYNNNHLSLTIAPTINCNLACAYCFESHVKGKMTKTVINGIAAFVRSRVEEKRCSLDVTWFGGEPLLYPDVIEDLGNKLLDICREFGVKYSAGIITNGTKYSPQVAEMLKKQNVSYTQITIDGDKWTHDCRRVYKGGTGSFDKIVENIKNTVGIIPISVRINIDRRNVSFAEKVYDYFKRQSWFNDKNISFYYGWVKNYTENVKGLDSEALTPEEYHQNAEIFKKRLLADGCITAEMPKPATGCVATNINGFVIGPTGDMWKCWNTIGDKEKSFGNVLGDFTINTHFLEYMGETWEDDEECKSCAVLPLCMGGCGDVNINRKKGRIDHKDCGVWRYHIEEKLRTYFISLYQSASKSNSLPFTVPTNV